MVFTGCTVTGMKMSVKLAERQRALSKLIEILLNLRNQICGLGVPLFSAFENIGNERISGIWSEIFLECGNAMKEQRIDAGEAWKMAIEKRGDSLPLDESDWQVLSDFGELLGKSGKENQESVLDLEKENLEMLEKKAREAMNTKGKLYRNLGVLSGAAAVILLI
ncbi:MAG: hypothetical protein GX386_02720 [Clostridiaceae bacterium]|jgi:stage III sporulation protein AB|nr:hypothetical protein [Clostridiaceae bacterium]